MPNLINKYPNRLLIIVAIHFIVFSIIGISRHWGYMTSANDLGCYDQAIWGVIHKGFLFHSFDSFGSLKSGNWLGIHFNPILYFFVPFYYWYPTVNWIIFAQTAALSLAAVPIFLLAKQVTNSEKQALLWSVIYLCNPFVLNADAWDFHPVSFAVPFMTLAFLAIERQSPWLFSFANLILLLCQEQFGLTVACLGLVYGFKNKERQISSLFIVLGIISFILVLAVVIPSFSPTKQHYMLSPTHGDSRYGWLGHSFGELIKTVIFSPGYVFKKVIFNLGALKYLESLLFPFLFTALAAPLFMLPMTVDLLANVLAENPLPRSIASYHSVTIIPVLTIASIYGSQKIPHYRSYWVSLICGSTMVLGYIFSPFSLPFALNPWQPVQLITQYDGREDEIKTLVGGQSVSAQPNVGVHFSQREEIYAFPDQLAKSDYVILWLSTPTTKYDYSSPPNDFTTLSHHLQMQPSDYLIETEKLLSNKNFKIVYWDDPWLVFKREPKIKNDAREPQVFAKIRSFRKKLQTQNLF